VDKPNHNDPIRELQDFTDDELKIEIAESETEHRIHEQYAEKATQDDAWYFHWSRKVTARLYADFCRKELDRRQLLTTPPV
jgi:hypothetical protein